MRKINFNYLVFIFLLLAVICSCSLNAEQESSLNESTTRYLEARKNGALLAYVAMQHPAVVRSYKDKGDSLFLKKFTVEKQDYFSDDPVIKEIEKKGNVIHVRYEARTIDDFYSTTNNDVREFIAISENDGKSWFYMDKSDYVDKTIAPGLKRLIKQ